MKDYDKHAIGKRIRALREAKRWTRSYFAEKLDVSDRYCSSIELGQKGMSLETLMRAASVLNVSIDYILTGKDIQFAHPDQYWRTMALLNQCPPQKLPYLEAVTLNYLLSLDIEPPSFEKNCLYTPERNSQVKRK